MVTFYIISAIIGGVLVLASAFLGGDHLNGEFSHDGFDFHAGDGHDAGTDVHSDLWLPFFSLRFWTYFFAFFGVTGLLMTKFTEVPGMLVPWLAGLFGVTAGLAVAVTMRMLDKNSTDSSIHEEHIVGQEARVLVPVYKGKPGKVRCDVRGEMIDLIAFTNEDVPLEIGQRALVVSIEGQQAQVVSLTAILEDKRSVSDA